MASEKALKQKEELVKALAERMKSAKVIILTDYRGINVADVTKLRADLRNTNSEYKVIKNNIIKRALDMNGESALDDLLTGPTAVLMGDEDYLEPSKVLYNFAKDNDFYKIKGGIRRKSYDSRRNYYTCKTSIKTRITCKTCWMFTCKYFKIGCCA